MDSGRSDYLQGAYAPKSKQRVKGTLLYLSDSELVRRCILYENAAWQELIRRHGGVMYAAIIRQLASGSPSHSRIEAEDILSRVFQRLLERDCEVLRNLRNPGAIRAYLCQIALTVTIDCLRRELSAPFVASPHEAHGIVADPYETIAANENYMELDRALEKLSDQHRLFLRLYYEQELAYKEIAELTRTPIRTVGTILHRARKAARDLLGEQETRKARS
jgi:RNA polymerase sigma-70 factor (ECF subfamily)